MDEVTTTDVGADASTGPAESTAADSPVGTTEASTPPVETEEAAAPSLVPENDDDLKGQENNPHVQAVIQLRGELRDRDREFKPWRDVVSQIGDPSIAKDYYELMETLHSPVEGQPNEFTTK